jgi:hypothetical protein
MRIENVSYGCFGKGSSRRKAGWLDPDKVKLPDEVGARCLVSLEVTHSAALSGEYLIGRREQKTDPIVKEFPPKATYHNWEHHQNHSRVPRRPRDNQDAYWLAVEYFQFFI